MRTLFLRLFIFPIVLIGCPLIYLIGYALVGHDETGIDLKRMLRISWYGAK